MNSHFPKRITGHGMHVPAWEQCPLSIKPNKGSNLPTPFSYRGTESMGERRNQDTVLNPKTTCIVFESEKTNEAAIWSVCRSCYLACDAVFRVSITRHINRMITQIPCISESRNLQKRQYLRHLVISRGRQ